MVTLTQVRAVLQAEQLTLQTKITANAETAKLFAQRQELDKKLDKVFEIKRKLHHLKPTRRLTNEMFIGIEEYALVFKLDNYLGYTIDKVLLKLDRKQSIIGCDFIQMNGWYPDEVVLFLRYRDIKENLKSIDSTPRLSDTASRRIARYGGYLAGPKWAFYKEVFIDLDFYKTIQTEFTDLITVPGFKKKHLEYFFNHISGLGSTKDNSVEVDLFNILKEKLDKGPEYLKLAFESWLNKTEHDLQSFLLSKPLLKELHEEWKGICDYAVSDIDLIGFQEEIAQLKADIIIESTDH